MTPTSCARQRVVGRELARRPASELLGRTFDPASHSKATIDLIIEHEGRAGSRAGHRS